MFRSTSEKSHTIFTHPGQLYRPVCVFVTLHRIFLRFLMHFPVVCIWNFYSLCCLCILFIVVYVFLDETTLTEVFPCLFLGCKANGRVILAKTGHGPHSSKIVVLFYVLFVLYCSMCCLCVNVYCHRVTTQLQLTNISSITVERGRPQMTIWRMHIAYWIPKAIYALSEYVIRGQAQRGQETWQARRCHQYVT